MNHPTDEEIVRQLVDIISDGFNRSLRSLAETGAIDVTNMRGHYCGVGSKYYDVVTEQIVLSAKCGTTSTRQLFD